MASQSGEIMRNLEAEVKTQGLPPLLQRQWVSKASNKGNPVRIMQWNVLAQAMSGVDKNFIKCPKEAVQWQIRKNRILQEILRYQPTVLCIEEVDMFDFLTENLAPFGYVGIFIPKPKSPCLEFADNMGADGCAMFYKTSALILSNSNSVSLKIDGKPTNQVMIFGQFQTKIDSPQSFYVGVTHLKAKPDFSEQRRKQGEFIADFIKTNCSDDPVIFCGDFNAEPIEPVYQIMKDLNLNSVYTSLSEDGKTEPKFTTWKIRPKGEVTHTIDYIWYSGFKVKAILDLPSEEEVGEGRLPSLKYPSDHVSLVCDLLFDSKKL
ncbi:nocturnin-like [Mya arenaria]|nr:nocturnin-like [Mya arenaria]